MPANNISLKAIQEAHHESLGQSNTPWLLSARYLKPGLNELIQCTRMRWSKSTMNFPRLASYLPLVLHRGRPCRTLAVTRGSAIYSIKVRDIKNSSGRWHSRQQHYDHRRSWKPRLKIYMRARSSGRGLQRRRMATSAWEGLWGYEGYYDLLISKPRCLRIISLKS